MASVNPLTIKVKVVGTGSSKLGRKILIFVAKIFGISLEVITDIKEDFEEVSTCKK